jgi:hypothetical protein
MISKELVKNILFGLLLALMLSALFLFSKGSSEVFIYNNF